MTAHEYNLRNVKLSTELIWDRVINPPKTETEKDIHNLKWMMYGIMHGSRYFRGGCVSTLRRAIKRLEDNAVETKTEKETKA